MGVASSVVEHSAFNRLVLSSNLRRPIFTIEDRVPLEGTRFFNGWDSDGTYQRRWCLLGTP
jgi:hypothetical protein